MGRREISSERLLSAFEAVQKTLRNMLESPRDG
jgi:hypothetical protein